MLSTESKIIRNYISGFHSLTSSIWALSLYFSFVNSNNLLFVLYSTTYFTLDSLFIIYNSLKYKTLLEPLYIFHHLVSIYYLNTILHLESHYYQNCYLLFYSIAEISNYPNYIIYHLLKTNYKCDFYPIRLFQLLWFSSIRIIYFTYFIYYYSYMYYTQGYFFYSLLFSMYLLGIFWSINQYLYLLH